MTIKPLYLYILFALMCAYYVFVFYWTLGAY